MGLVLTPHRYMSTRDTGEQRSLLRVISTILQLTRLEVEAVEARIAELERTMVINYTNTPGVRNSIDAIIQHPLYGRCMYGLMHGDALLEITLEF